MAYEGGYPAQQRPYAGQAAPRQNPAPAPMQGPGQYQQQGYDDYQGGQGYDYYDDGSGGYGPDYGQQYQDPSYGQGPPDQRYPPQRQDYYGAPPPNGPPMGGRGGPGPLPRSQTMGNMRNGPYPPRGGGLPSGPGRGHPNGPPRGGGPPGAYGRGPPPPMDMPPQGRPPMNGGMRSPVNGRFGGNQFPNQPQYDETQLSNQMGAMDISQRPRMPMDRHSDGAQRGGMRPPEGIQSPTDGMRGLPPPGLPRGFDEGRRGSEPAPGPGFGPAGQGQGYAEPGFGPGPGPLGPPGNDFGPPSRSMTMPMNDPAQRREPMPPQPPMPYGPVPGRGLPPPQRPATSQSQRPPPQRIYPNQGPPPQPGYGGGPGYGNGPQPPGQRQASRASYDDIFDSYGGGPAGNGDYPPGPPNDMGYYNGPPRQASLGGSMDPYAGPGGAPNGPLPPGPVPQALNIPRTKSQPNLRNGQPVFEMSGDIPPMPNMPGQPGGGPGQPGGRPGPVGLPANPAGPRGGPGSLPPNPSPSQSANPDALPSHPTPVRPGLMADSVVNVANKPPPVRTYGTSSPAPTMNSGPPSTATPSEPPPDPVTSEELERLRVIVKADPNDQETGLRFAKRLVEAADVLVPNVADPKTRARSRDRYLADAYKVLKKLANAQNKEAMFFFADCIGRSLFSNDPDHKEAFTLYQSAAKLGHAAAAYRTAVCCEIGHEDGGGTRKDPLKAIQWYKRAATLGDTPAMYKMGMIQLKGLLGQPKNPREAIGWLKRAADQSTGENPHALHELGLLYESAQPNDVIIRDEKYAFTLFKKAAELGYKFSQFRLGCAYEYGLMGCPIDPRLSIMWYSKAAMQEEHQAELALSGWYLTGSEGVLAQSDTEAYLWARKAAMAGLAKAEYAMGYFTEDGIGVPANMEDAKRWYWRAAAQDFPKARERLEDLKRSGKNGPRQRERISRSKMNKQQEGECSVM